ncbi:hypothetical protein LJC47_04670 [Desulfosarcina sp. OttesenSCG-928-B08]|nr:hypothetical protein [Desulfosarcina sp. OttesenSCG-928-B08]
MLSEQEIELNMRYVRNAIAQQRLEGLEVPEETVNDLKRVARGELTVEEGLRNVAIRYGHVKI